MLFTDELTATPVQTPSEQEQLPPQKVEAKKKGEGVIVQLRMS